MKTNHGNPAPSTPQPTPEPPLDVDARGLIAAIRQADRRFEADGASGTRTWVREYFVPSLATFGLAIQSGAGKTFDEIAATIRSIPLSEPAAPLEPASRPNATAECPCGGTGIVVTETMQQRWGDWPLVAFSSTFYRCQSCGDGWYQPLQGMRHTVNLLKATAKEFSSRSLKAEAEITRLTALSEGSRQDTELLDWMQDSGVSVNHINLGATEWEAWYHGRHSPPTLRDVINLARRAAHGDSHE